MTLKSFVIPALATTACLLSNLSMATGSFEVTYEPAKAMEANSKLSTSKAVYGVETFDQASNGKYDTDFGTAGKIKGTYTGLTVKNADKYGGAKAQGKYAATNNKTGYMLKLSPNGVPGVNYFGFWLSALDGHNQLDFYKGEQKVGSYKPADLTKALGKCDTTDPSKTPYCGNPNNVSDKNFSQHYAFVNFFYTGGYFDTVKFHQSGAGGYESDNHTVAYCADIQACMSGKLITKEPVPSPKPSPSVSNNSHGDVHISTPDGLIYDFQATGEFYLTLSSKQPGVIVQARQANPVGNSKVSVNTAAAIMVENDKLEFYGKPERAFYLNGEKKDLPLNGLKLPGGGRIIASGNATHADFTIMWPHDSFGARVIILSNSHLDIGVKKLDSSVKDFGSYGGIIGNFDGNAQNDMQVRDGDVIAPPASIADLNRFGDSWRVKPEASLFGDVARKQAKAAAAESAHSEIQIPQDKWDAAEKAVKTAGVTSPLGVRNATYDVALTGDKTFIESAKINEADAKANPAGAKPLVAGDHANQAAVAEENKANGADPAVVDLVLTGYGQNKIAVIKVVRQLMGWGLRETKEAVENAPSTLKQGISKQEAEAAKQQLEAAGATVEIKGDKSADEAPDRMIETADGRQLPANSFIEYRGIWTFSSGAHSAALRDANLVFYHPKPIDGKQGHYCYNLGTKTPTCDTIQYHYSAPNKVSTWAANRLSLPNELLLFTQVDDTTLAGKYWLNKDDNGKATPEASVTMQLKHRP
jgi:ribosomal protein L7/L12